MSSCRASVLGNSVCLSVPYEPFSYGPGTRLPTRADDSPDMRQRLLIFLGSASVALAAATAVLAGTIVATATVSGSAGMSMTLPSNPSLSDTLDGTDQIVSWSAPLGIVDARG